MNRKDLESAGLISSKTNAVYDYEFTRALQEVPWAQWLEHLGPFSCREEYLEKYHNWIQTTKLNQILGLNRFEQRHLINGTTQSFDELYFRYYEKRLRIFRGEYAYHRRVVKNCKFIEDGPLEENDYLIISAPFCSTGDVHPEMYDLFDAAEKLGLPVAVDCAYFGTCTDFTLDVSHPAIESVSFSLTKGIGLGDIRSGIRYSNIEDQGPICQQNHYNHSVLAAAKIGIYMMEKFSPDFIPQKYKKTQHEVCKDLGITPTKCMHLALGGEEWEAYRVDNTYNRIGIRGLIKDRYKKNGG